MAVKMKNVSSASLLLQTFLTRSALENAAAQPAFDVKMTLLKETTSNVQLKMNIYIFIIPYACKSIFLHKVWQSDIIPFCVIVHKSSWR